MQHFFQQPPQDNHEAERQHLLRQISDSDTIIKNLRSITQGLSNEVQNKQSQINSLKSEKDSVEAAKNAQIAALTAQINAQSALSSTSMAEKQSLKAQIGNMEESYKSQIHGLVATIRSLTQERQQFQKDLKEARDIIEKYEHQQELVNEEWSNTKIINFYDGKQLNEWIIESLKTPKIKTLVYRGTEHGFAGASFHKCCDGLNLPTVIIIMAKNGCVFGGMTTANWRSENPAKYSKDDYAFLFSLRCPPFSKREPKKFPCKDPSKAIICSENAGPIFGEYQSDIYIANNCDKNADSTTNFCHSYEGNMKFGTQDANIYFCGYHHFNVAEIEVFTLE